MLPMVKVLMAVWALLVALVITTYHKGRNSEIQTCPENQSVKHHLRERALNAIKAFNSTRKPSPSTKRAARGQHVFNNGLLGFHRSVLQQLLRDVGGYDEQLGNLMQFLIIPLTRTQQHAIKSMVAYFSPGESYVDYNADVYGEYVKTLRNALVKYLKAETSVSEDGRYGIRRMRQQVRTIATQMVNHEVYVDPMARDRWLQEHSRPENVQLYNNVRNALKTMFQDILQDFQNVSDQIRVFRRRPN